MAETKYTIIVPSYRGGEYLKQCVRSVLAQTYPNFELAVLENGNLDGSVEWLASLHDPRIKVYPSAAVLSIENNWARALEIPRNEFITFFGHDDLMDANYLKIMDALIDADSGSGLYFAHFRYIDENGATIRSCLPVPERETGAEFLEAFLQWQNEVNGTGYMMRSKIYDAVGGIPRFKSLLYADHALWFMLTHDSRKVTAPEECFSYRLHPASTSTSTQRQDYLQAITQFIDWFVHFQSNNQEFTRASEQHGPVFFFQLCDGRYLDLLIHANITNQRLESHLLNAYAQAQARILPSKVLELKSDERVRFHQFINGSRLLRLAYIAYLSLPRGKAQVSALVRWFYKSYTSLRVGWQKK